MIARMSGWEFREGYVVAPVLEVIVAEQCNLTCASCSHLSPIAQKGFANRTRLATSLERLRRVFRCEVVKLIGGEPLLHPDLEGVVETVRAAGIGSAVHLVTNGLLFGPRRRAPKNIDQITVSTYPSAPLPDLARAELDRAARAGCRVMHQHMSAFQMSHSGRSCDDPALIQVVYDRCKIAHQWCCFTLREDRFFKCPQAYSLPLWLGRGELGTLEDNGLRIDDPGTDDAHLKTALLRYLGSPNPLPACRGCYGSAGKTFSHHMTSRRDWRNAGATPYEAGLDAEALEEQLP